MLLLVTKKERAKQKLAISEVKPTALPSAAYDESPVIKPETPHNSPARARSPDSTDVTWLGKAVRCKGDAAPLNPRGTVTPPTSPIAGDQVITEICSLTEWLKPIKCTKSNKSPMGNRAAGKQNLSAERHRYICISTLEKRSRL